MTKEEERINRHNRYVLNRDRERECGRKWYLENTERHLNNNRAWRKRVRVENPAYSLWRLAKDRASKNGWEFSIAASDIKIQKTGCPALKEPYCYCGKPSCLKAPSLDRINSKRGYPKGNIQVISLKANRIKNDATLDELIKIGEWAKGLKRKIR